MKTITPLKYFQEQTVDWMINHEKLYDGGMVFNSPGLGKTLCCLDLIIKKTVNKTLIVCPAGLIQTWIQEITKHTDIKNVNVYHGSKRKVDDSFIHITSFTTLCRDRENIENGTLKFDRIILDESHYIRNSQSKIHKAIIELGILNILSKKWVVTATPIFNKIDDMYGYFLFLNFEEIDTKRTWNMKIGKHLQGMKTLNQWILKHSIGLQKEDVFKELKNKINNIVPLTFTQTEQDFYDALVQYSITRMRKLLTKIKLIKGKESQNKTDIKISQVLRNNVMVFIIRLKQVCDSIQIITKSMNRIKDKSIEESTKTLKYYTQSLDENEQECGICYDNHADHIATPCGHKLCKGCWNKIFRLTPRCPVCRCIVSDIKSVQQEQQNQEQQNQEQQNQEQQNQEQQNQEQQNQEQNQEQEVFNSTKFDYILNLTTEILNRNEKVVIVSQYVTCLDLVKTCFAKHETLKNKLYITIQGSIGIEKRMEMINSFQEDSDVKICFLSLLAGSEGLTLTAANNLIFIDKWWNESKMIQCADRIHRIGQEKQVTIYNLKIKNSIEEKIEQLVLMKGKMSNILLSRSGITDSFDISWMSDVVKLLENTN
jgi:SNF2 family DNA or RNA helicase